MSFSTLFFSTSGMVFLIVTLKPLWKKEALKWIIPRSIAGFINYSSSLALAAKKLKRAVDKFGDTIDFILSEHRDEAAATAFFKQAIDGIETAHMIRKGQLSEENIPCLLYTSP